MNLLIPLICFSKALGVALQDAIEYYFFNKAVFKHHNFPDIRRKNPRDCGVLDAAISGFQCSWFIYLPLAVIYSVVSMALNHAHLHGLAYTYGIIYGVQFAAPIVGMLFDRVFGIRRDMFCYHGWMYTAGFLGEVVSIVLMAGMYVAL